LNENSVVLYSILLRLAALHGMLKRMAHTIGPVARILSYSTGLKIDTILSKIPRPSADVIGLITITSA
jgi:hypothetical protein